MCQKMSVYAGEKRDQVNILRLCCGCGVCGVFACCGCGVCGVFAAVLPRQYLQHLGQASMLGPRVPARGHVTRGMMVLMLEAPPFPPLFAPYPRK